MGIVERAAARLEAVRRPEKPLAVGGNVADAPDAEEGTARPRQPKLIERAGSGVGSQADLPKTEGGRIVNEKSFATDAPAGPEAALAARKNPRILEIDLKRLRENNIIAPDGDRTPIEECFRRIKRHVLANVVSPVDKSMAGAVHNLVMVTSALPNEGKTFCAINLAISLAMEMDRTVLLVDADTIRPSVLPVLGLKSGLPGLMDVLSDRRIDVGDVLHRTNIEKLSILPAGTPHRYATEMLASETMRMLVRELAERYDDRIVIFDSPPLLVTSESSVLATHMSQVMLVVTAGQTTETALKDALRRLEGCRSVGLLLNKGQDSGTGYGYGYGYGYD